MRSMDEIGNEREKKLTKIAILHINMPDNCRWAFHFINSKHSRWEIGSMRWGLDSLCRHVLSFYLTNFIKEGITLFLVCLAYTAQKRWRKSKSLKRFCELSLLRPFADLNYISVFFLLTLYCLGKIIWKRSPSKTQTQYQHRAMVEWKTTWKLKLVVMLNENEIKRFARAHKSTSSEWDLFWTCLKPEDAPLRLSD